jgi:hypothetical protein
MASSARTQASNTLTLIPKFKEGDIVAYSGWEHWFIYGKCETSFYKIDCFEQYGGIGIYRCRVWSYQEKRWVNTRPSEMTGDDGRVMFQWGSQMERELEVAEPLGLLVKWGIG